MYTDFLPYLSNHFYEIYLDPDYSLTEGIALYKKIKTTRKNFDTKKAADCKF
jgi:hypothetical protein